MSQQESYERLQHRIEHILERIGAAHAEAQAAVRRKDHVTKDQRIADLNVLRPLLKRLLEEDRKLADLLEILPPNSNQDTTIA